MEGATEHSVVRYHALVSLELGPENITLMVVLPIISSPAITAGKWSSTRSNTPLFAIAETG
jgi:hypothetical protein